MLVDTWAQAAHARKILRVLLPAIMGALIWAAMPLAAQAEDHNGITSPVAGAPVRGVVAIEAIADHPDFRKWQVDLLLFGDPEQAVHLNVGEEPAYGPTVLTGWDTTPFPDGDHVLRLRVVRGDLNYDEYYTPVRLRNVVAPVALTPVQGLSDVIAAMTAAVAVTTTAPVTATEPITVTEPPAPSLFRTDAPPDGHKRIEVDLSDQTLTVWQGDVMVFHTLVSTGKRDWRTLPGTFKTYVKYEETRMRGAEGTDEEYDTPDVPWTMYYSGDFAIHGAYWHNSFGTPVSHGCVNMRVDEAKALYEWAPLGTEVVVHP